VEKDFLLLFVIRFFSVRYSFISSHFSLETILLQVIHFPKS